MKTTDLTVLFLDSVPSRIYLALLNKHGYKPSKIIYIQIKRQSKKFKLLEKAVGSSVTNYLYSLYGKFKSKPLSALAQELLALNNLTENDLRNCLKSYKSNEISNVSVENLDDAALISHIQSGGHKTILFTGGGILKEKLLSTPKVKFIHIHPGIVPDIRGADCLYWSYLLRGKAGYSAFYMNAGIDTGDVLIQKEFDVDLQATDLAGYDNDAIYIGILMYYDPCLRIKTFIELLNKHYKATSLGSNASNEVNLSNLPYEEQDPQEGRMYFYMHKDLRDFVINKLKR